MQIIFKHKDLKITDAIKDHAIKKFESLSNHVKEQNSVIEIEISKNSNSHNHGDIYEISTNIIINKNRIFVADHGEDLYALIDNLKNKVLENVAQSEDKRRTKERSFWRRIKDKLKGREKFDDDGLAGEYGNE